MSQPAYIMRPRWIPYREQLVQCPLYCLDALSLILGSSRQSTNRDVRPIVILIELQQLQIANKYGEMRRSTPIKSLWLDCCFGLLHHEEQ